MKRLNKIYPLLGMTLLLLMIFSLFSSAWAGGVKVITGQGTSVDSIDDKSIKSVFLGKKKTWPDGSPIEFVILKSGDTHETFLKTFVKKSRSQFKTYWKKQVFTGKGKNPKSFDSEIELVAYVAGKVGSIGYVAAETEITGAKVLNTK